jgi:tetratricopeptide (TPR) repeat protein
VYAGLAPHIEVAAGHASDYPVLVDILLRKLGIYFSESGQLGAARTTFERVLAIREASYDPGHPKIGMALGNLGGVQWRLGDVSDARRNLERALATLEEAYGPDHYEVARAHGNLGSLQWTVGELRGAQISIERALAIFQVTYSRDHPEVARTFVNLGVIQRDIGNLRDARASIERGLAIYEAAYGPNHPAVAEALLSLGEVQLRVWKLRDTQISIGRAAAIFKTAYKLDPKFLGVKLNPWGRAVFKRRKIAGFVFFVFLAYATVRTEWRAVDDGAKPHQESRQSDPVPGHQSRGDLPSPDQNISSVAGSDDPARSVTRNGREHG